MKHVFLKLIFLFAACLAGAFAICALDSKPPFEVPAIVASLPYQNPEPTSEEQSLLDRLCSQPFEYLGEGGQCYAFSSSDGKYVLKVLKYQKLLPSRWVTALPEWPGITPYRVDHILRKQKKLQAVFEGHHLAYHHLKEESSLHYIQLKPSHQGRVVTLIDKNGKQQTADLGESVFFLQEKGEILSRLMERCLQEGRTDQAKGMICQVIDLYLSEHLKGIGDQDFGIMHNIGFVDGRPLHLDVGKLVYSEGFKHPLHYRNYLFHVSEKINTWIDRHYPLYSEELSAAAAAHLAFITEQGVL